MEADERRDARAARAGESWWTGPLGDLLAAAVVIVGGGVLGGFGFGFGPGGHGFGGLLDGLLGDLGGGMPVLSSGAPPRMRPEIPVGLQIAGAASTLISAGAMFLRRRRPLTVFAVLIAVCVVAIVCGLPTLAPGIAATVAMFALAYRAHRRLVLVIASSAAALLILLSFAAAGWSAVDMRIFQIGAAIAVAAALGDGARSRREYLRALRERAERAEHTREAEAQSRVAEERLRIARELHDAVGHQISVINLNAGLASARLREEPERAERALETIRRAARGALTEIGDLLRYLRAEEDPLPPRASLADLDALLERMRESGLVVEARIGDGVRASSGAASDVAYRVVQEGLVNAHKHGAGQRALLRIERSGDGLSVEIENPVASESAGQRAHHDAPRSGFGLLGLRERVAAIGGTVESGVRGDRFVLTAHLPLQPTEEES